MEEITYEEWLDGQLARLLLIGRKKNLGHPDSEIDYIDGCSEDRA